MACVSPDGPLGNRSLGGLTAVDHTEHGFAEKLKAIGRGIAGILQLFGDRQRLPLPEPQDFRRQDRCDVDESLFVGPARSFSAVGHGRSSAKERHRSRRWPGQVRGRARPLLSTYRAEERIDGKETRDSIELPSDPLTDDQNRRIHSSGLSTTGVLNGEFWIV
jgi:hypothetical protein